MLKPKERLLGLWGWWVMGWVSIHIPSSMAFWEARL